MKFIMKVLINLLLLGLDHIRVLKQKSLFNILFAFPFDHYLTKIGAKNCE